MRATVGFGLAFVALASCSETQVLQYQGRPAATALECQAAYEEARRRGGPVVALDGPSLVGAAIGRGIANGIIEGSYETCLARVAALRPGTASGTRAATATYAPATSRPQSSAPALTGGCVAGGPVLQGGSSYCYAN